MKAQSRPAARHPFLAASTLFGDGAGEGRTVDNITSKVFESHLKIFAPLYAYEPVPRAWEGKTWADFGVRLFDGDPREFAGMEHAHVTFIVPPHAFPGKLSPVSLQDVYAELGLAWNQSSSVTELLLSLETPSLPCELFGPDEGILPERTLRALFSVLRAHTRSEVLNCYFDEARASDGAGNGRGASVDLYSTDFEGLIEGTRPAAFQGQSPCLLWPEDERWSLHCDFDATYILLGGSRAFIEEALSAVQANGIDAVLVEGAPALVELEGDPGKKGLLWDSFPSPYAFGPLSLSAYTKARAR